MSHFFGPLCPEKEYEVQVWANKVKHYKICADLKHEGKCLKGTDIKDCDHKPECRNEEEINEEAEV